MAVISLEIQERIKALAQKFIAARPPDRKLPPCKHEPEELWCIWIDRLRFIYRWQARWKDLKPVLVEVRCRKCKHFYQEIRKETTT